jgi:hypothetical protein
LINDQTNYSTNGKKYSATDSSKYQKKKENREAYKDFKKFKSEFKKVIALNSNLQAQIESISGNRLLRGSNSSNVNEMDNSPSTPPFKYPTKNSHKRNNEKFHSPNLTSNPYKENVNIYYANDNTPQSTKNTFTENAKILPIPANFGKAMAK